MRIQEREIDSDLLSDLTLSLAVARTAAPNLRPLLREAVFLLVDFCNGSLSAPAGDAEPDLNSLVKVNASPADRSVFCRGADGKEFAGMIKASGATTFVVEGVDGAPLEFNWVDKGRTWRRPEDEPLGPPPAKRGRKPRVESAPSVSPSVSSGSEDKSAQGAPVIPKPPVEDWKRVFVIEVGKSPRELGQVVSAADPLWIDVEDATGAQHRLSKASHGHTWRYASDPAHPGEV